MVLCRFSIMLTRPCYLIPLQPHLYSNMSKPDVYKVKLYFAYFALKRILLVLVKTAPMGPFRGSTKI